MHHRHKKKPIWITKGLIVSIKHKNKLYKNYLKTPTDENKLNYKIYRNKLNHVLRIAKKNHYTDVFNNAKNDIKTTWKNINDVLHKGNKNSNYPETFNANGSSLSDAQNIADGFNNFFVNLGPNLAESIPKSVQRNKTGTLVNNPNSFFLSPVSAGDIVKTALECIKPNKAAGCDGLRPFVIRQLVIHLISDPLTYICNLSFSQGIFPNELKIAKVIPIFKKGDKHQFVNYRPISVLPCFSKILERLMFNKIILYLNKYNILSNSQYGFRPGRSTELALIDVINKLNIAAENNKFSIGIFLDLSKAFDTHC